jgi:hypothetical protein
MPLSQIWPKLRCIRLTRWNQGRKGKRRCARKRIWRPTTATLALAIEEYKKLNEKVEASKPNPEKRPIDAADLSLLYSAIADLHRRAGEPVPASTWETRRFELWRE